MDQLEQFIAAPTLEKLDSLTKEQLFKVGDVGIVYSLIQRMTSLVDEEEPESEI